MIRWDKTQNTWHTDVGKVGRYSVQPVGNHVRGRGRLHAAFLNNERITNAPSDFDADIVKRHVEDRIETARRINRDAENINVGLRDADKKLVGFVDMTPTWGELAPLLVDYIENGNAEQQRTARVELTKMATAADAYNAMQRELSKCIQASALAVMTLSRRG